MPIWMPKDTRDLLGPDAKLCDSRSLFLDRFANPEAREHENERKHWFTKLIAKPVALVRPSVPLPPGSPPPLYAQLQSRLMVNMAGGVMENAGLCLDRFGMPYIPGSAVKGCARRAALAALHEWTTTGTKPGSAPDDADNLFTEACRPFASPEEMLARIALVFGWTDSDWKDSRNKRDQPTCDFVWATEPEMDPTQPSPPNQPNSIRTRQQAARLLAQHLGLTIPAEAPQPWTHLPSFAGSVGFLHAHVVPLGKTGNIPGLSHPVPAPGEIELDVLTCHHGTYYGSPDPHSKARDTEDPVPVFFPAVAAGQIFSFGIVSLRSTPIQCPPLARSFLSLGLAALGLGAKTSAGYGWFDASPQTQSTVGRLLISGSLKPDAALLEEMLTWDDKKIRKAASQFAYPFTIPTTGRESSVEYQFTLVKFILQQRCKLYTDQKAHAGSDFAKGVKSLANKFGVSLP
jgi:CRISPR/Cas system CMR subunit Cmr6 (Cas7 group RAMP superfamily)